MGSIDTQIDAAVLLMKARAAEFDGERPRALRDDPNPTYGRYVSLAYKNMRFAATAVVGVYRPKDLLDTMNLCALALSLIPDDGTPHA